MRGCEKFVPALAHLFCLALPAWVQLSKICILFSRSLNIIEKFIDFLINEFLGVKVHGVKKSQIHQNVTYGWPHPSKEDGGLNEAEGRNSGALSEESYSGCKAVFNVMNEGGNDSDRIWAVGKHRNLLEACSVASGREGKRMPRMPE